MPGCSFRGVDARNCQIHAFGGGLGGRPAGEESVPVFLPQPLHALTVSHATGASLGLWKDLIVAVELDTGTVQVVAALTWMGHPALVVDLAFGSEREASLYGLLPSNGMPGLQQDALCLIDTVTGQIAVIFETHLSDVVAMTAPPRGSGDCGGVEGAEGAEGVVLFLWSITEGLHRVCRSAEGSLRVSKVTLASSWGTPYTRDEIVAMGIETLCFRPDGCLYGVGSDLLYRCTALYKDECTFDGAGALPATLATACWHCCCAARTDGGEGGHCLACVAYPTHGEAGVASSLSMHVVDNAASLALATDGSSYSNHHSNDPHQHQRVAHIAQHQGQSQHQYEDKHYYEQDAACLTKPGRDLGSRRTEMEEWKASTSATVHSRDSREETDQRTTRSNLHAVRSEYQSFRTTVSDLLQESLTRVAPPASNEPSPPTMIWNNGGNGGNGGNGDNAVATDRRKLPSSSAGIVSVNGNHSTSTAVLVRRTSSEDSEDERAMSTEFEELRREEEWCRRALEMQDIQRVRDEEAVEHLETMLRACGHGDGQSGFGNNGQHRYSPANNLIREQQQAGGLSERWRAEQRTERRSLEDKDSDAEEYAVLMSSQSTSRSTSSGTSSGTKSGMKSASVTMNRSVRSTSSQTQGGDPPPARVIVIDRAQHVTADSPIRAASRVDASVEARRPNTRRRPAAWTAETAEVESPSPPSSPIRMRAVQGGARSDGRASAGAGGVGNEMKVKEVDGASPTGATVEMFQGIPEEEERRSTAPKNHSTTTRSEAEMNTSTKRHEDGGERTAAPTSSSTTASTSPHTMPHTNTSSEYETRSGHGHVAGGGGYIYRGRDDHAAAAALDMLRVEQTLSDIRSFRREQEVSDGRLAALEADLAHEEHLSAQRRATRLVLERAQRLQAEMESDVESMREASRRVIVTTNARARTVPVERAWVAEVDASPPRDNFAHLGPPPPPPPPTTPPTPFDETPRTPSPGRSDTRPYYTHVDADARIDVGLSPSSSKGASSPVSEEWAAAHAQSRQQADNFRRRAQQESVKDLLHGGISFSPIVGSTYNDSFKEWR